jgi:probable F420-dependent oxidoreductase
VRFGLALPHYDFSLPGEGRISFRRMADWAVRAEDLGFDSVWISDHFVLSLARYGGSDEMLGALEPLTALAGLAARTTRVRLGTLVLSAPFRHPAIVAKMASAIDLLSSGRVDLGIGAGWYADEFRRFGYDLGTLADRFDLLEEYLQVLSLLFAEGPSTFRGERFRLQDATMRPRAMQRPRPPIWLGAKGGPRALGIAARHADGWNTAWRWELDRYAERVRAAREACARVGRDPSSLRLSIGLYAIVGEDQRDLAARIDRLAAWAPGLERETASALAASTLCGAPDEVLERIGRLAELGVEEIILSPAHIPFAIPDASMVELLAERVVAPARSI